MAFVDPYFDESIGELRNLLGVKSAEEFQELEPQIVFANELELESISIPRSNDFEEVLLIHKQLFRQEVISRLDDMGQWLVKNLGVTDWTVAEHIPRNIQKRTRASSTRLYFS